MDELLETVVIKKLIIDQNMHGKKMRDQKGLRVGSLCSSDVCYKLVECIIAYLN